MGGGDLFIRLPPPVAGPSGVGFGMWTYDGQLLWDYANDFLGYGAFNSRVWLVGSEAGGGKTIGDVYKRALVWADRGREEIEDLHDYHRALKIDWMTKVQSTWGPLIRVLLALDGRGADTNDVREFQREELGRFCGQNAVLDLSQLSSPSKSVWKLDEFGIDWLATRESYEASVLPLRRDLFKMKLARCEPKPSLVLFYGGDQRSWEAIAGCQFKPSELRRLRWVCGQETLFAAIPHPLSIREPGWGANNRFFANVGAALRDKLRQSPALNS